MASTGHAAIVCEGEPVVVVVEASLAARIAMAVAGLVLPVGLLLSVLSADEQAPLGREPMAPFVLALLGVLLLLAGVGALLRGTVRARLLVGEAEVDALGWTFAPARVLRGRAGASELTVELSAGPVREALFRVAGAEPVARPLR